MTTMRDHFLEIQWLRDRDAAIMFVYHGENNRERERARFKDLARFTHCFFKSLRLLVFLPDLSSLPPHPPHICCCNISRCNHTRQDKMTHCCSTLILWIIIVISSNSDCTSDVRLYFRQATSTRNISWCWFFHNTYYHRTHKDTCITHTHTHTCMHVRTHTHACTHTH